MLHEHVNHGRVNVEVCGEETCPLLHLPVSVKWTNIVQLSLFPFLQALANSVLLPVIAIGFVMLILNLNIDPAGPRLQLNFNMYSTLAGSKGSPGKAVVPVAGPAPTSLSILGGSRYLEFDRQDGIVDSIQLSDQLLRTYWGVPARFGKFISSMPNLSAQLFMMTAQISWSSEFTHVI